MPIVAEAKVVSNVTYAVTCRHVIEWIHEKNFKSPAIQLNRADRDGIYEHQFKYTDWTMSADSDLAVWCVDLPEGADYWPYPMYDSYNRPPRVVAGYDIFSVGLFSRLPGEHSVDALVRSGKVARSLTKVRLVVNEIKETEVDADAHIVESRSWGGESGSPVFLYKDNWRISRSAMSTAYPGTLIMGDSPDEIVPDVQPALLGIMHGHYKLSSGVSAHDGRKIGNVEVNSGVGVVIPVEHLARLLMTDKLSEERQKIKGRHEERYRRQITPTPSSTPSGEESFTREDFESALKKASQRIQPSKPDEGK